MNQLQPTPTIAIPVNSKAFAVLLGCAGSGKSTICKRTASRLPKDAVVHLEMSDLLEPHLTAEHLALKAAGDLYPLSFVNFWYKSGLLKAFNRGTPFIFGTGLWRRRLEVPEYVGTLQRHSDYRTVVFNLTVEEDIAVGRILERPLKMQAEGKTVRADDIDPAVARKRWRDHHAELPSILREIRKSGIEIHDVDVSETSEAADRMICDVLGLRRA